MSPVVKLLVYTFNTALLALTDRLWEILLQLFQVYI